MIRLLGLAILVCAAANALAADPLVHVRIDSPLGAELAAGLLDEGFDVLEPTIRPTSFEAIVNSYELAVLEERGYAIAILAVGRPFRDIQAEDAIPPGYPELAEIIQQMQTAAAAYPSICRFVDLTATYGVAPTVEGRHVYAVKVSDNVAEDENEPAFLLVSDHHAREIVTPVIALYALDRFTTQYGVDPRITALVDEYELWIAPVWNPDGYNWVFVGDNLWRKNRRVFTGGIGVDLNRNYPFGWNSSCAGSTLVTSETYRGPEPASEAETLTMIALGLDRRFAKVADLHSYAMEVRYGYGCWNHPFMTFLRNEASALAGTMSGYTAALSCCTAGNIHWHMGHTGTHAFLWETHTSFQPTYANAQAEAVRVFPSLLALLERPISVSGRVTDAVTGQPVAATLRLVGVTFPNGEVNASGARLGRYHAILPAGNYTLEFSAPGYVTQTHPVTVTLTSATVLNVTLSRPFLVGDLNCDGNVDFGDINPFVLALTNPAGYAVQYPNCDIRLGDMNGDGICDFGDINPFVRLLTGP